MKHYDPEFYDSIRSGSRQSARFIAPLIVQTLRPESVLDVGCGQGVWLSEFGRCGVTDIHGVDGDHVSANDLLIRGDQYTAADLEQSLDLQRRFDLVVSLEVAEHLSADAADAFVESLVRHSACVLFSAAIPCQGGTSHINEQWPSYWVEKFASHRYQPWDLRSVLWERPEVDHWYAQNMLLLIEEGIEANFPALPDIAGTLPRDVVHPRQYLKTVSERQALQRALWEARALLTRHDIARHIPAQCGHILLDDGSFPTDPDAVPGTIKRVLEADGIYGGTPADGNEAIATIEDHRQDCVQFLVQTWLAFWWEEAYTGFATYLDKEAECLVDNERCRVYRFRERRPT